MLTTKPNRKVQVLPAYTVSAAARALNVSGETIYCWLRSGRLQRAELQGGSITLVSARSVQRVLSQAEARKASA